MSTFIANDDPVSRTFLEKLRIDPGTSGDHRLDDALIEYDLWRFALAWVTCLGLAFLIVFFVHFVREGAMMHALLVVCFLGMIGRINRIIDRKLQFHFNKRIYEAVPVDLRWCRRQHH